MSPDDLSWIENAGQLHGPAFVLIPNARYRRDIGQRLIEGDFAQSGSIGFARPLVQR
ncbi:MAG: hypothetical protein MUO41_05320 [Methyloceanibacter sp.]|nr:hypothetical protein [Methyloceanibacter sp.]